MLNQPSHPGAAIILFFSAVKSLIVCIWSRAWARVLGWLKCQRLKGERVGGTRPSTRGLPEGPSKAAELWRLAKRKRYLPSPAWGCPACRGESGGGHLVDEFHLLMQEMVLQKVTEMGVSTDRSWGMQI